MPPASATDSLFLFLVLLCAFILSPFPEPSRPQQGLHPCSLIIFSVIYWLFLSAEAGSLSQNPDINNAAFLGSHTEAVLLNYQAVSSWSRAITKIQSTIKLSGIIA